MAVIVVEDADLLARIKTRLKPRNETYAANAAARHPTAKKRGQAWKGDAEWSRIMNARRMIVQSGFQRRKLARAAARARWHKRKPSGATP